MQLMEAHHSLTQMPTRTLRLISTLTDSTDPLPITGRERKREQALLNLLIFRSKKV